MSAKEFKCSSKTTASGFTPLMHAVMNAKKENFKKVLKNSTIGEINAKNSKGWTALHLASRNSSPLRGDSSEETVSLLLKAGADANIKTNNGWTPLHMASKNSSPLRGESSEETVKILLEASADVNAKDNDGWTPLHMASRNSSLLKCFWRPVQMLIQKPMMVGHLYIWHQETRHL